MLRTCILTACLAAHSFAQTTLHVDDNGSLPGQFSTIGAALASASPGDRIVVQDGTYPGFTLSKGVTIVGNGAPRIVGAVQIQQLPANALAVLSGFQLELQSARLLIANCSGTVWVDSCEVVGYPPSGSRLVELAQCADVRLQRTTILPGVASQTGYVALQVTNSRLELTDCELTGGQGGGNGHGGVGLRASSSRVHLARTSVRGGQGAPGSSSFGIDGQSGGDAIEASSSSTLFVAGDTSDEIKGGRTGQPQAGGINIEAPGWGVQLFSGSTMRHSGVPILTGDGFPGIWPSSLGATTSPSIPDPTLELLGETTVGAPILLVLHGPAALNGRLQQGKSTRVLPDSLSFLEQLNDRFRLHALGPIGASGDALFPFTVPANVQPGWLRTFQGLTIEPLTGDTGERTNSLLVLAR